jgi:hypothetical protein
MAGMVGQLKPAMIDSFVVRWVSVVEGCHVCAN